MGVAPIKQYTHLRNKNSNTQGSPPYVEKVILRERILSFGEVPFWKGT